MTGQKQDAGKPRFSLLPAPALWAVVRVLEHGATKYEPDGWRYVPDARTRYFNAAHRHLAAWWSGEPNDVGPWGSGLPHLAHAVCCLLFLLTVDEASANAARDPAGRATAEGSRDPSDNKKGKKS